MANCNTCKANKVCNHDIYGFENCDNYISADVVEVVRCKDCVHCLESDTKGYGFCSSMTNPNYVKLDHFCSYGVRKTEPTYCKDKQNNLVHCEGCHEIC